jgi:hypothetical protein
MAVMHSVFFISILVASTEQNSEFKIESSSIRISYIEVVHSAEAILESICALLCLLFLTCIVSFLSYLLSCFSRIFCLFSLVFIDYASLAIS